MVPVEKFARFAGPSPETELASMVYAVGALPPAGAAHVSERFDPDTEAATVPGAAGARGPTSTITSLDAKLAPAALVARTRMK